MWTLNLMTSLRIFSISVCSSSRRVLARRVSCSNLGGSSQHTEIAHPNRPHKSPIKVAHTSRPYKSPIQVAHTNRPYKSPVQIAHAVMFYLRWSWRKEGDVLDVGVHLTLLHELDALVEPGAHLCELLLHLLDLSVGSNFLCRCDL